jgi:hypothetical protein
LPATGPGGSLTPLTGLAEGINEVTGLPIIPLPVKLPGDTNARVDEVAARARDVADKVARDQAEAANRNTNPGTIVPTTTAPVTVGPTPINPNNVEQIGTNTTHAPDAVKVNPMVAGQVYEPTSAKGIGSRIAGSGNDVVDAGTQNWQVDRTGAGYQNQAAAAMAAAMRGDGPSVAREQMRAAQDRAAAEQLSIAAGARGQSVASARRNAAVNVGNQQIEAGGKMAELRAQEIATATAQLAQTGGQMQGQALQETTSKTGLNQQVELQNAQARDTAIQASRERFAKGELTQAQLETEIAKANADYAQRTGEVNQKTEADVKMEHARQQLQADLASDDRLQSAFNLHAQLEAQARAGNQDAQVKLQALQAQINVDLGKFNANQIQTATGQNIANRLTAMHLDDTFTTSMTQAWLAAEREGDAAALEAVKIKINAALQKAQGDQAWRNEMFTDASALAGMPSMGGGADSELTAPKGGDDIFRSPGSDSRLKTDVKPLAGPDVDGFLKAIGKTQTWRYKDAAAEGPGAEGTKLGPMAQDMAEDKLGSGAVGQRPDGKLTLDYQHLAALAMAGLGRLNERVQAVEGKRKGKADEAGFLRAYGGR